jgi:1,4-dihydroxy-2-naphthoate octaprenyltransferase
MSIIANWREVLQTANLSPEKRMDVVSRWLIITRAAVFSMTLTSGLIGGLLPAAFSC